VNLQVGEFLVQALEDIENEGAVVNDLTEISKNVGHPLHLAAVVVHGEIALNEDAELGVEVKSSRLAVAEEPILDGEPRGARRVVVFAHAVHEVTGDRAEDPRQHDDVHAAPGGMSKVLRVGEDVAGEGVALQREENEIAPAIVVGGEGSRTMGTTALMFWMAAAWVRRWAMDAASKAMSPSSGSPSSLAAGSTALCSRSAARARSWSRASTAVQTRAWASVAALAAASAALRRASRLAYSACSAARRSSSRCFAVLGDSGTMDDEGKWVAAAVVDEMWKRLGHGSRVS
jgi:hypothetical protein